jgi:tRNA(Ile)-lysidine synthase
MGASPTRKIGEASVAVAFSGGVDSTALLIATAHQAKLLGLRVVALHVHHGLMAEADTWAAQAGTVCERLGVELRVQRLKGRPAQGDSVEAWARQGRYAALAAMAKLEGATLILLAQHADDQAETVLLQALRGAGPAGLAAMPAQWQDQGLSWARPWLLRRRAELVALVEAAGLPVVLDPSNTDPRYARSRLRSEVLPLLEPAFPQAVAVLGEVARHAAQARELADEVAAIDLPACHNAQGELGFDAWRELSPARRRNVLQAWLARQLPAGVPVSLLDRLMTEWRRLGREWPAPGGRVRSVKAWLRYEASPPAK